MNATLARTNVGRTADESNLTREDLTFSTVVKEETHNRRQRLATQESQDHPWFPFQILLAYWICGPLAGGVVAGLNFARMGKREYLIPCFVLGAILFLVPLAGFVSVIHDPCLVRLVILLTVMTHFTVGLALMFEHQPHVEDWQNEQRHRGARGYYWANHLEVYFLACIGCWIVAMVTTVLVGFVTLSR
jgi:hypothetical protein